MSVLDAQRSLFAAQQVLVLFRLEQLASQVRLYAVLGGGRELENQSRGASAMLSTPTQLASQ